MTRPEHFDLWTGRIAYILTLFAICYLAPRIVMGLWSNNKRTHADSIIWQQGRGRVELNDERTTIVQ